MKKVLIIAYQFPPMGGSGVQRTTKFVKYLRNCGWEPIVLTRSVKGMELKDESLLQDIPEDVSIVRTKAYDLTGLPGLMKYPGKFIGRKVFIPDAEMLWRKFAVKTAVRLVSEGDINLIYSTSYPYSDHMLALSLKKKFPGIPWAADFRDEWTNNPYLLDNPHNKIRMSIERRMEKEVLDNADVLITNTPIMLKNFLKMNDTLEEKFYVIPNGYDAEDFSSNPLHPSEEAFTITYSGLLFSRRKPNTFFRSLSELIAEGRIDSGNIKVNLIGNFKTDELNDKIASFGLSGIVELFSYMNHDLCLEKLQSSNALLLIEGVGPGAEAFYTGKVFEYIRTGRPILAVIPGNGAAAGIIRETNTGLVADFNDIEGIKHNLIRLYEDWKKGRKSIEPDNSKIEMYDRRNLTKRLAELFNMTQTDKT
ncbi:MAG: glycosyltransferase [Eubacteriales bacterium]|nr:glycosyltransferase [Eubacteriales bacterium]